MIMEAICKLPFKYNSRNSSKMVKGLILCFLIQIWVN